VVAQVVRSEGRADATVRRAALGARPLPRRSNLRLASELPSSPLRASLIERAVELEALASAVRRLTEGTGGVIVLEASAGLGKTALLEHAATLLSGTDCLVRRAAPGPLERHFSFGVVRALLESPLREAPPEQRAHLLEGAAAAAGKLLLEGTAPGGDGAMTVAHSVLWLCAALAETRPLALVVDDAQWADRSSLEVLSYLARRVDDLPLLIVIGARADAPDAATDLLSMLGSARSATVLHPQPLTARGAAQLIRRIAPDTPTPVCHDSHRAVGGNPWLLRELGRQIAARGPEAIAETGSATDLARRAVRRRMSEVSPRDRGVAQALAVIGDGVPQHVLAAVAGVPVGELGPALDALVAAGLLARDGRRFAHGLIAVAVADDLPRTERERLHREAARVLMDSRADTNLVASHLLECGPQADPDVSEQLLRAASAAAERGVPRAAAAYLERALEERAPGDDRGRMLALLGTAASDAGLPDSRRRLRQALTEVRDRESRIDVLNRLSALNLIDMSDSGLVELFEQELAGETDADARLAVEAASLDALLAAPERHEERARRAAEVDLSWTADPLLVKVVLAHRLWIGIERGTYDAGAWGALAQEALQDDLLLRDVHQRAAYTLCLRALTLSDNVEAAERAIIALQSEAANRGSLRLRVAAAFYGSELALRTARVAEAENLARLALDVLDEPLNVFTGGAVEVLVNALIERGAFQEARDVLHEHGLDGALGTSIWQVGMRHARARLWLAEGDYERAHAEAIEAGALREQHGRPNPAITPWRSTAAIALAHLGRRDEAIALADAELELAERFGAPTAIIAALHARAVADPDHGARVELCERALAIAAPHGLARVRVQLELGSALSYLGRRVEAREALRPALADADEAGAVVLADRARRELVATGLRPRQAAIEGAASLTPRQRQICELASAGRSNRAIAQELFLSVKTVETHLAAGFRKLGVATRAELSRELT
jgi:DNA-binding CsgD family transcriptional regulator/tetratricopeptide (TPR) repeat protein